MKIIIGLGNPDKQYKYTRHNAGFMMVERINNACHFPEFKFNKDFNAELARNKSEYTENKDVMLVKPCTMMNNSGEAVRSILDFYKLKPDDIIVIHDDIDLALGKYRISADSSSAGHRGVQDIMGKISVQKFTRVRIGIANPDLRTKIDPSDFVLQKFSEEELKIIENISEEIIKEIEKML